VILVTGATQGIGRAVALAAAQHGATVVLLARGVKRLEAVYDEIIGAGGPEPAAIPLDLLTASDDDLNAIGFRIHQELGRLDGIVHCASHFYALSPLRDQGIEEWMNQFRINTVAPWKAARIYARNCAGVTAVVCF
jgi:NAD(P)-dependent dehydrogenase (short-subunit alcohol dehydrogenase family)